MSTSNAHRRRSRPITTVLLLGLVTVGCTADPDARASDASPVVTVADTPPTSADGPAPDGPAPSAARDAPDPLDPWKDPATADGGADPAVEEACGILERMAVAEAAAADLDGLLGELDQPLYDHGVLLEELATHLQATGGADQVGLTTDLRLTGDAARTLAEDLMRHRAADTGPPPVLATEHVRMLEQLHQLMYTLRLWEVQICDAPAGSTVTRGEINGVATTHVEFHPSPWLHVSDEG